MEEANNSNIRGTARFEINKVMIKIIQVIGTVIDNTNTSLVLGICGVMVTSLFAYMYFALPWILWKHMLIDVLMFLMLPSLLAFYSSTISDIADFLKYEDLKLAYGTQDLTRDAELYLWEAPKYYTYVERVSFRYISKGYNVNEDQEEAISPEPEAEA